MKTLFIFGKADSDFHDFNLIKKRNNEIWATGTDPRDGADKYFEFHGIEYKNRKMIRDVDFEVYVLSKILPLNNSISLMIIQAVIWGYKDICVVGCPMNGNKEMEKEKPALAMVIGYCLGKGINIIWKDGPKKDFYLKKILGSRAKENKNGI